MYLKNKKRYNTNNQGYITLISILIVGAVGAAVGVSLLLLGLGSSRTGLSVQQSAAARALATACAETALQNIRDNTPYIGTGNLSFAAGTCTYTVTAGTGQNRTVNAIGTAGTIVRKARIAVTAINPRITYSWQEVP